MRNGPRHRRSVKLAFGIELPLPFRIPHSAFGGWAVRLDDFRQLVERLVKQVPAAYLDGVVVVEVSPKALPHPRRADVYTLGECIPLEWSGNGADLQSRVVL